MRGSRRLRARVLVWLAVGAVLLVGCGGPLESAGHEGSRAEIEGELAFGSPWHAEGAAEGHDVMVTGVEGEARRLTGSAANDRWPTWSPDGQELAFASDRDSPGDIFVLRADGQLDNLTDSETRDAQPAWSPDGTRIAFVRSEVDGDGELDHRTSDVWVMQVDGSEPRNLTDDSDTIDAHPSWSPDGERLVFMSTRENRVHLWVFEVDSGQLHELSEVSQPDAHTIDAFPAWSPDGEHIAFISNREGVADVWLMEPDGQGLQRLTNEDTYETGPLAWSPDGQQLAVASTRTSERIQGIEESLERSQEAMTDDAVFGWITYEMMLGQSAIMDGLAVLPIGDDAETHRFTDPDWRAVEPTWRADGQQDAPVAAHEVGEDTQVQDRGDMEISADITIDGEPIGRGSRSMNCESVMLDLPDADERDQHERHLRIEPDEEGQTATIRLEMPFREGEHSEVEDDGIRRIAENVETIEIESRRIRGRATLEPEFPEFNNAQPVEIEFDIKCGYRGD